MFSLFKKKNRVFPVDSKWSLSSGQNAGKPMVLRRNDSGKELAGHPDYSFRVGVAIPLHAPNDQGLPGMEEMAQLDAIEDELSAKLERDQRSLQVLVITTGGMREFVFYTRDPQDAQASIEALQSHITTHELQFYIESDGQWGLFKEFS